MVGVWGGEVNRAYRLQLFVNRYGADRLRTVVELFERGHSAAAVGRVFGVSRTTGINWRNMIGTDISVYEVHQDVVEVCNESPVKEAT